MTRYIRLDPSNIPTINSFDKIFIGDEGCGKFLLSHEFCDQFIAFVRTGANVGLIAPFLTPETEVPFSRLLEQIPTSIEVAVNDVGAFTLVKESRHIPIIGRLLSRQNTDPAIWGFTQAQPDRRVLEQGVPAFLKYQTPPEALLRHWQGSPLFCKDTADLFADRSPLCIMLDVPPQGLPDTISERFTVMAHLDTILIAMLPCGDCESCPQQEMRIGMTRTHVPIYRKRNTCYYKWNEANGMDQEYTLPEYVTRTMTAISEWLW